MFVEVSQAGYAIGELPFFQYRPGVRQHFSYANFPLPSELLGDGRITGLVVYERDSDSGSRRVDTQDHPELFEEFAYLTPDEKQVLSFAKRYGLLGAWTGVLQPTGEPRKYRQLLGEPLVLWTHEIVALRVAVFLWETLEKKDESELRKCVQRTKNGGVALVNPLGFDDLRAFGNRTHEIGVPIYWDEVVPSLPEDDVQTPAYHWLQKAINERLKAYLNVHLVEDGAGNLIYEYQSKNLLGALWYQLSQVVTGVSRLNRCLECNKPIIVKRGGRSDKVYCSNKCKMRASRAGKRVRKRAPDE